MPSRLDRLVSLLESGSSNAIRSTAAKQLAQLATKSVPVDIQIGNDTKHTLQQNTTQTDYDSLLAVVARILPCLRSKNFETRTAASSALLQICTTIPPWTPSDASVTPSIEDGDPPQFPLIDLQQLMYNTPPLVATSGKEFAKLPAAFGSANDVKRAKKEAMKKLGLDFLEDMDGDAMDWEKELVDEASTPLSTDSKQNFKDNVKMEADDSPSVSPPPPATEPPSIASKPHQAMPTGSPEPQTTAGMSARELNRLKRKRKGNAPAIAPVAPPKPPPDSKYSTTPAREASPKVRLTGPQPSQGLGPSPLSRASPLPNSEKAVVDPSKGGQVETAKSNQLSFNKVIEVAPGAWPWEGVLTLLEYDMFDPSWTTRHGAACGIRDILKFQGESAGMNAKLTEAGNARAHEAWCNHMAGKIICILILDRFCDFSNDQSVSPVRETSAQTLASLMIHMPKRTLICTHDLLLRMTKQEFSAEGSVQPYVWQVRHGGMLGLKYEVAVRRDLLVKKEDQQNPTPNISKTESTEDGELKANGNESLTEHEVLRSVVSCAILGLGDSDDDVRSVAAATLLPVAADLVALLPSELPLVLSVLWEGLATMKDDLSSSVGAVMELLGCLVVFPEVVAILADPGRSKPLSSLAPILFLFFRHTIPNVRMQVITTLHSFLLVGDLPKDWISSAFLCLLFQNLIVEEREKIREATLKLWRTSLELLSQMENVMQATISSPLISDWCALMLQPWGQPLDGSLFYRVTSHGTQQPNGDGAVHEKHNVDKAMLAQEVALVTSEVLWEARLAAAHAIGFMISLWPNASEADTVFRDILLHYISSNSALQRVIICAVIEEFAKQAAVNASNGMDADNQSRQGRLGSNLAIAVGQALLSALSESGSPTCYHEIGPNLRRLSLECSNLLSSFVTAGYLTTGQVPEIPQDVDFTGQKQNTFTLSIAEQVAGQMFTDLQSQIGRIKKKEFAPFEARKATISSSILLYTSSKERYDVRILAACASALIALEAVPAKVGTVVKNLMNGVKFEETVVFQTRFATALASMVELGLRKLNATVPMTKVVKNLCAFLCSDPSQTPAFAPSMNITNGVLSFQSRGNLVKASTEGEESEDLMKARVSRRGAELALVQLSHKFGETLFESVPMIWESTSDGLRLTCGVDLPAKADQAMEQKTGQDVIDSLVTLQTVVPALHSKLWGTVLQLLDPLLIALQSRFAVIRQAASKCMAAICDVITLEGMRFVVERILPLLGDALSVTNRQGAIEAIHHIVSSLDTKALQYVIFLVVPVLGRMSDTDDDIRSTSTNVFAALVKMVPLEVGLPDPEGFPASLLERRAQERLFLTQLLDGSKVEPYEMPVVIKAELRKYQVDGVNWLAFLSKYQLHGILCDDMGLGKTLQSICILSSKHFERAQKNHATPSPEFAHLPSLIVCPPTLTGHWYYEILKYAENLTPVMYSGAARDRTKMLSKLSDYDVVITSYEVVRNDIQSLSKYDWLFCILDEGHIIKNGKTKLTKSVKLIRAQHRLILSGTPIQNNVLELWSLFDFLMPGFLGSEQSFNERYGKPILANRDSKSNAKTNEAATLALEALHKQVLPFLLRRLKEDVLSDLPPKIIQDYYCELSDLQKQLYDDFAKSQAFNQTQNAVEGTGHKAQQHVFQSLQYLKKLCNHPALVLKDESEATKGILEKYRRKADDASPLRDLTHAPKLQALRQLLTDCGIGTSPNGISEEKKIATSDAEFESGGTFSQHRVLIFCQMKQMLDIIETDLFKAHMPSVTYMRLDGGTDSSKRHAIVQTFNSDPSIDCLLLTTHVGGLGLTLTGADTVIFVEHDWNPMKDLQAMDRAHRIGQKKVVNVYRLITKDTLEEKIMGLQRFKLNIANSVITQQNSGLSSMSTELVLDLFKRTAQDDGNAQNSKSMDIPNGKKNILAGLEDLPAAEEYEGLDISSFLSS